MYFASDDYPKLTDLQIVAGRLFSEGEGPIAVEIIANYCDGEVSLANVPREQRGALLSDLNNLLSGERPIGDWRICRRGARTLMLWVREK